MEDYEKILKNLQQIEQNFGIVGLIIILIICLTAILLFSFAKSYIVKSAETASEKSMIKFQNKLDERLDTKMKFFFRNEEIRNSLISNLAIKSIDMKLSIWKETYQLYFDFQKSWNFYPEELSFRIIEIDEKYQLNREKIFLNSVFLGGFLTEKLITLNNSLRNAIRLQNRINNIKGTSNGKLESERSHYLDKIDKLLPEIQDWLSKNLIADHNSTMWDFSPEQLDFISKHNNDKFEELKQP